MQLRRESKKAESEKENASEKADSEECERHEGEAESTAILRPIVVDQLVEPVLQQAQFPKSEQGQGGL